MARRDEAGAAPRKKKGRRAESDGGAPAICSQEDRKAVAAQRADRSGRRREQARQPPVVSSSFHLQNPSLKISIPASRDLPIHSIRSRFNPIQSNPPRMRGRRTLSDVRPTQTVARGCADLGVAMHPTRLNMCTHDPPAQHHRGAPRHAASSPRSTSPTSTRLVPAPESPSSCRSSSTANRLAALRPKFAFSEPHQRPPQAPRAILASMAPRPPSLRPTRPRFLHRHGTAWRARIG